MRVTLSALQRQPEQTRGDDLHGVVQHLRAGTRCVRRLRVRVVHRLPQKTRRGKMPLDLRSELLGVVPIDELVPGQLLEEETVVRDILVDRGDHVVTVAPDTRLRNRSGVVVVAKRVDVAGGVEPVPAPAFAVVRRGQELIDEALVGCRRAVSDETIDRFGVGGRPMTSS